MPAKGVVKTAQSVLIANDVRKRLVQEIHPRGKVCHAGGSAPGAGTNRDTEGILCHRRVHRDLVLDGLLSQASLERRIHEWNRRRRVRSQKIEMLRNERGERGQPRLVGLSA